MCLFVQLYINLGNYADSKLKSVDVRLRSSSKIYGQTGAKLILVKRFMLLPELLNLFYSLKGIQVGGQ